MNVKQMGPYRRFRAKAVKWLDSGEYRIGDYIFLIPDIIYLLVKLILDNRVDSMLKLKIAIAFIYYISPFDLVPEYYLGIFGLVDDFMVLVYVLNETVNRNDVSFLIKYWPGKAGMLNRLKLALWKLDSYIGSGLIEKIKKMFKK